MAGSGLRAITFALLATVSAAAAQDRPAIRPSRDVAVLYRAQGPSANGTPEAHGIRMFWTDQGRRLRLEMEGAPGFALVDFVTNRMTMVMMPQKLYLELPFDPGHAPGLDIPANVAMQRMGDDTVASTACTVWKMTGERGGGTACITSDGLLLRVRGAASGQSAALEAVSVAYGPQSPDLFAVPSGFRALTPR
jgi:hypothetical protein